MRMPVFRPEPVRDGLAGAQRDRRVLSGRRRGSADAEPLGHVDGDRAVAYAHVDGEVLTELAHDRRHVAGTVAVITCGVTPSGSTDFALERLRTHDPLLAQERAGS